MNLRYVAFSEERGIFLGVFRSQIMWSKAIHPDYKIESAPTFSNKGEFLKHLVEQQYEDRSLPLVRMVEVWPDKPDNRVSQTACANAGLPSWLVRGEE